MAYLHERTGVVIGDRQGYPIVRFDDPTRCCDHPDCRNTQPYAQSELIQRQRIPVGTRVRTYWMRGGTWGGMVAEVLTET